MVQVLTKKNDSPQKPTKPRCNFLSPIVVFLFVLCLNQPIPQSKAEVIACCSWVPGTQILWGGGGAAEAPAHVKNERPYSVSVTCPQSEPVDSMNGLRKPPHMTAFFFSFLSFFLFFFFFLMVEYFISSWYEKWDISSSYPSHFHLVFWRRVDLQCHVNFCCTAKRFSYTCVYIFFIFFSIMLYLRIVNTVAHAIQSDLAVYGHCFFFFFPEQKLSLPTTAKIPLL